MLEKPKYVIDLCIQFEKIRKENNDFKEIGEEDDGFSNQNKIIKTQVPNNLNIINNQKSSVK